MTAVLRDVDRELAALRKNYDDEDANFKSFFQIIFESNEHTAETLARDSRRRQGDFLEPLWIHSVSEGIQFWLEGLDRLEVFDGVASPRIQGNRMPINLKFLYRTFSDPNSVRKRVRGKLMNQMWSERCSSTQLKDSQTA